MDRRKLIGLGVPAAAAAAGLGSLAGRSHAQAAVAPPSHGPSDRDLSVFFPEDAEMSYGIRGLLGSASTGGALSGEVFAAVKRIRALDQDSWHETWTWFADRISAEAAKQQTAGHDVSARGNYLRASNYYRISEFFLHGNPSDPRMTRAYKRTVECYTKAGALFRPAIVPVQIPYEGTTLPGYMSFPKPARKGRTTIIMHTGFDGSAESMHFGGAADAMERGYNVLTFDGPGQFGAIHRQGLPFRYDWERVITPVMDFVLRQPGVDPNRVALMGASLGGYLAPRAAVFEKRIKALICNDGVYDFSGRFLALAPPNQLEQFVAGVRAEHAPDVDALLQARMAGSPNMRWFMTHGMYAFGVKTPRAFVRKTLDFHLRDGLAERISCPTLVCNPHGDHFNVDRANPSEVLFSHLTCRKTLMDFTVEEGAGEHCQIGADTLAFGRIYDWLDEVFA